MTKAVASGMPKLRIEEASARTQARIDAGQQAVIGVNKHRPAQETPVQLLKVDNAAVRQLQLDKLARLKRERDPAAVAQALAALTRTAAGGSSFWPARRGSTASSDCARRRGSLPPRMGPFKQASGWAQQTLATSWGSIAGVSRLVAT